MFSRNLVILFLILYEVVGSKKFRSDYTYYQNVKGWLKFHVVPGTWSESRSTCFMEGAVLASPVHVNMLVAIDSITNKTTSSCTAIYTGIHSLFSKGYYSSLEGELLSKMPVQWMLGEPDNADNNEDCIAYMDGKVADVNCSEVLPFVCYKKDTGNLSVMPCGTIDKDYIFNDKTRSCYKLHKYRLTWTDAFKVCTAEGGHLVIINSKEEASVVRDIHTHHYRNGSQRAVTYIGMIDWDKVGVWRTVHGQTLIEAGYDDWDKGQPDNAGPGQYCGAVFPTGLLDDYWCDRRVRFLCEKDPDSLQE